MEVVTNGGVNCTLVVVQRGRERLLHHDNQNDAEQMEGCIFSMEIRPGKHNHTALQGGSTSKSKSSVLRLRVAPRSKTSCFSFEQSSQQTRVTGLLIKKEKAVEGCKYDRVIFSK